MSAASYNKIKIDFWDDKQVEAATLRVPVTIIALIVLWGIDLWILDKLRIQYHSPLSIKSPNLTFVFATGTFLAIHFAFHVKLFSSSAIGLPFASEVAIYYCALLVLYFIPGIPGNDTRNSFFRLVRLIFMPLSSITFPEVLLADAFTSISKVLKDFGVFLVKSYAEVSGIEDVKLFHESAMILIALLASFPFWIRVRQCWVQFEGSTDGIARIPIALNMIKYMTAFPPIWITAAASLGYYHSSLPSVIALAATINSLYSFLWDVIMDWGLVSISRDLRVTARQRMLLPWPSYALAVVVNLTLRFSWAMNRLPWFKELDMTVVILTIELGEIFRRAMWNIFRIEWEIIVQQDRSREKEIKPAAGTEVDSIEESENASLLTGERI